MAVNNFSLYLANGTTPVAIPVPNAADWQTKALGSFADGTQRVSLYKTVTWKYRRLSAAQYQLFATNKLAGRQTFETWVRPTGGVAGQFVVCTGILSETMPGILSDGVYSGVVINWIMVL